MIKEAFQKRKSLFIPFTMAGYPTLEISTQAIMALSDIGSDIIELGIPFSDPIADGPVNQKAAEIALDQGMQVEKVLTQVKTVRQLGCKTPIILFSYLNPILPLGYEKFLKKAQSAGVNGVLVVDLPPEEGEDFYEMAKKIGIEIILLASPTTDPDRFTLYQKLNPSFVYYISRLAVTGIQQDVPNTLAEAIQHLREYLPNTKIAVGFGISSAVQAEIVSNIADGVIVGSQLVSTLGTQGIEAFKATARSLSKVIHAHN